MKHLIFLKPNNVFQHLWHVLKKENKHSCQLSFPCLNKWQMLERSTAEREMMHRFKRIENFSRWFPVSQISFPCVFGKLWHAWVTLDFITEVNGWPAPAEQSAHQEHSDLSLKKSFGKLPISDKQNEKSFWFFVHFWALLNYRTLTTFHLFYVFLVIQIP